VLVLWLGLVVELVLVPSLWQPVVSPMIPIATAALRADLARDGRPRREADGPLAVGQGVGPREGATVISDRKQQGQQPIAFNVADLYALSTGRRSWRFRRLHERLGARAVPSGMGLRGEMDVGNLETHQAHT